MSDPITFFIFVGTLLSLVLIYERQVRDAEKKAEDWRQNYYLAHTNHLIACERAEGLRQRLEALDADKKASKHE